MQAGRGHGDHGVTCPHPIRTQQAVGFHHRRASSRDVVLVGCHEPGCSAVSPPSNAQPACSQPVAMPLTIAAIRSGTTFAGGDVVGHEQRLRATDDQVVDDHRDQVDADGVVDVHGPGDRDLRAHTVSGGGQQRALETANAEASNSPAKPPRSPTTSGASWLEPEPASGRRALPASTSTPASA